MLRWVEARSYVGPDRRGKKRFRLFNRRRVDLSEPLPGVQVLLRLLHLRVLDLKTAREAMAQFRERVNAASHATREVGQTESAAHLDQVKRKLRVVNASGEHLSPADAEEIQQSVTSALAALR